MPQPSAFERELQALEAQLKKVEDEYNDVLLRAGPPSADRESRRAGSRLQARRPDALREPGARFQFSTLQARYPASAELWDRGVRAREEGRAGPSCVPRRRPPATSAEEVVHAATFRDPVQEVDKLRDLYDALMQARREEGATRCLPQVRQLVKDQLRRCRSDIRATRCGSA